MIIHKDEIIGCFNGEDLLCMDCVCPKAKNLKPVIESEIDEDSIVFCDDCGIALLET